MKTEELIRRLEEAYGCLIGSHTSGSPPSHQFKSIIEELKQEQIVVSDLLPSKDEVIKQSKVKWILGDDELPQTLGEVSSLIEGAGWVIKKVKQELK